MGQGFQIEIRNATNFTLVTSYNNGQNLESAAQIPTTIAKGTSSGLMYFENGGSSNQLANSDVSVLIVNYAVQGSAGPKNTGTFTITLDPKSTSEFNGSIYLAGFTPPAIATAPAWPLNTNPAVPYTIYPYLILNQVFGAHVWPYASITIVQVVSPTMSVYTPPS